MRIKGGRVRPKEGKDPRMQIAIRPCNLHHCSHHIGTPRSMDQNITYFGLHTPTLCQ